MKKLLISALMVGAVMLAGCDSGDEGDTHGGYVVTITVESKSQPPAGSGAIRMYGGDGWEVLADANTVIQKQRPSCSGLDNGGTESIVVGDIIEFDVEKDRTTYYPVKRTTASEITAYRKECLYEPDKAK